MEAIKNYCSVCLRDTNHQELFREKTGSELHHEYHWNEDFLVVKCMGCNNVSFRTEYYDEDSRDPETGELEEKVSVYPLAIKGRNLLPYDYLLPYHVKIAYNESINALKNNCRLLAAAGFRAVIEAVCKDKGVKGKDIKTKIDNLATKGFLSKTEADRLHAVRFLGNDSIHEIEVPDEIKLNSAVVIIEHLLTTLYLLDKTISSRIETMIVEYHNFEDLINYQISALKKNDEADLKTILGKSIRRITSENLNTFQEKLYGRIRKGEYENLNLGSITKEKKGEDFIDVQNYVKTNDSKYDFLGIKLKRHNRR